MPKLPNKSKELLERIGNYVDFRFGGEIIDLKTDNLLGTYDHRGISVRHDLLNISVEQGDKLAELLLELARAEVKGAIGTGWLDKFSGDLIYLTLVTKDNEPRA